MEAQEDQQTSFINNFQQFKKPTTPIFQADETTPSVFADERLPSKFSFFDLFGLSEKEFSKHQDEIHSSLQAQFSFVIPSLSWFSLILSSSLCDFLSPSHPISLTLGAFLLVVALLSHSFAFSFQFITPVLGFAVAVLIQVFALNFILPDQNKILTRFPEPSFALYFITHRVLEVSIAFFLLDKFRFAFPEFHNRMLAPSLMSFLALLLIASSKIVQSLSVELIEILETLFSLCHAGILIAFIVVLQYCSFFDDISESDLAERI